MSKHTPGPWSVAGMQTGKPEWNDMRHIFSSHDRNVGGTGHIAALNRLLESPAMNVDELEKEDILACKQAREAIAIADGRK